MPHDPLRVNHEDLFQVDQSPPLESDNVSAYRLHCIRFIPSYRVHLSPATTSRMNYPQSSVQLLSVMELALSG
jgi:hypothetical protein